MSKQTAVEWYSQEHLKLLIELENKRVSLGKYAVKHQEILQQAKQMEREQIVTAYCSDRYPCSEEDGEQYFTETYGDKQ
jgi:hypothetical protein